MKTNPDGVFAALKRYVTMNLENHTIPQYKFLIRDDGTLVDCTILKTESLKYDLERNGFTNFNVHDNKNHVSLLNTQSIQFINDYYALDFEYFGYLKN